MITFLSGKGGTGKTALCAAVATLLAKSGNQVLCIDGDVGLRNLDLYLGLHQAEALSFVEVARGDYPLSAALNHPQYSGLFFLTAPANAGAEDISRWELGKLLKAARKEFDFILIDGASGIDGVFATYARESDRCLLTTLPDPASIRCTERAAQELEKLGVRDTHLVVNRVFNDLMHALGMNIDDVMDEVGLPLLGIVPSDPNISIAMCKGKPFIQYSRAGAVGAYKRIAQRLQGQPVPVANR